MTESTKAVTAIVQLSDTLSIDGYMMPDGEFRAGIAGASVLLGHGKDWFNRLASRGPKKLEALQSAGFTGRLEPVVIPRESGTRGASRATNYQSQRFDHTDNCRSTLRQQTSDRTPSSIYLRRAGCSVQGRFRDTAAVSE